MGTFFWMLRRLKSRHGALLKLDLRTEQPDGLAPDSVHAGLGHFGLQRGEKLADRSVILQLASAIVGATRWGVRGIQRTLSIKYLEVVWDELEKPAGLTSIQVGLLHELLQVLMVREDLNVLSPFQVMSPMSEAHNNGHELLVIHRVSQLGTGELARVVRDRVPAVFERLG
jgi:hypothetical protein